MRRLQRWRNDKEGARDRRLSKHALLPPPLAPLTSSTKHLCCCILVQHTLHWHTSFSLKFSALSLSRGPAVTWGGGGGTGGGSGLVATSRLSELELWRRGGVMFVTFPLFPCEGTWCCFTSADLPAAECSCRSLLDDLEAACEGDR